VSEKWERSYLIKRLTEIKDMGYVPSRRSAGNVGSVGNTLEDLLGIKENNLPMANLGGRWELKAQVISKNQKSYLTFLHKDPFPRDAYIVTRILLPLYGWPSKSHLGEMSFRGTMRGNGYTNRGFKIDVNRTAEKVYIEFNCNEVKKEEKELEWLADVEKRVGLGQIHPQPYWSFDIVKEALSKCQNLVYVLASQKKIGDLPCFHYYEAYLFHGLIFEKFIDGIENGIILADFDARTTHNHGTKLRIDHKGRGDKVAIVVNNCATFYQAVEREVLSSS
jgi:hypothetical protein